jgi:hypothetical protein
VRFQAVHHRMSVEIQPLPEIVPVMVIGDRVLKRIVLRFDVCDPSACVPTT